ncbi:tetratricopeptide repeat protein [Leptothermofonsia sichuanensis]|uniref:tetratricopeptide repeat protein n=1 Tax=Leptothermofonsia sichuanensis TaxID=2917832 RepID=UPI001EEFC649|nr:tetratricopeptide repeat protein [Leptothermofonsia sichuanensis]
MLSPAAETVDARKTAADRLLQQGIQQYQTSQFTAALQSWQQALDIYRAIKDRQGEEAALGNLGLAYLSLGNYGKAIEFYEQSLAIAREINDRQGEGIALSNIGFVLQQQQQPELAIVFYKQSVNVRETIRQISCRMARSLQKSYTQTWRTHYRRAMAAEALLDRYRQQFGELSDN